MSVEKIKDFGDTVAGAKKALWRERGFMKDDITDMAEKEIIATVIKKNIWKEPDYAALFAEGCYREDLYYLKLCYVALGASITANPALKIKTLASEYADFVISLRDWIMPKVKDHTLDYDKSLISWLFNTGYLEKGVMSSTTLTLKANRNPAFGAAFVSFLNHNLHGFIGTVRYDEMRELIARAQGDTDECVKARTDLCLKSSRYPNYASKSFFIDCYASGFPLNYISAVKNIVCFQSSNNKEPVYKIGPKTQTGINITYPCEAKEPLNRVLGFVADGTYTKAYQAALDLRKAKKNEKAVTDDKKPITVERIALPNRYVLRKGPRMRKADAQITALLYDEKNVNNVSCFNFRGGEFGNWQNKRQECLNCAVDSFSDLAYIADLPFSAMSVCFTGRREDRLTIAWGSRGSGRAMAHYEPITTVINLTKYKGAGSLAHEWGHALDHAIGKWCLKGCNVQLSKNGTAEFATNIYKRMEMTDDETTVLKMVSKVMSALKHKEVVLSPADKRAYCKRRLEEIETRINDCLQFNLSQNKYYNKENAEAIEKTLTELGQDLLSGKTSFTEYVNALKQHGYKNYIRKSRLPLLNADLHTMQHPDNITAPDTKIMKTEYYTDAQALDCNRKNAYYSQNVEMFARAFESFVEDELKARNMETQYLVHGTNGAAYKAFLNASPYPMGEERAEFNKLFRELLDTVADIVVGARFNPTFKGIYQKAGFDETKYFEDDDNSERTKEDLQVQAAVGDENLKYNRGMAEVGHPMNTATVLQSNAMVKEADEKLVAQSGELPERNKIIHCIVTSFNEQMQVVAVRGIGDNAVQYIPLKAFALLVSCKLVKVIEGAEMLPEYVTTVVIPSLT